MRHDTADITQERGATARRRLGHRAVPMASTRRGCAAAACCRSRPSSSRWRIELGASLVEYALLIALIAVACIGAVTFLGGENGGSINQSKDCIEAAQEGRPLPAECP